MRLNRFNAAEQEEIANVCGLLVHARPGEGEAVAGRLVALPGVEIHAVTPEGKLIVTAEDADGHRAGDTIGRFNDIEGIVSVALVYHHFDSEL